jgi:diguanylate cyclase (GGDEF)-like protein
MLTLKNWKRRIHQLSIRQALGDGYDDFKREFILINIHRIKVLIAVMILLFAVLLVVDYVNFTAGRWALSPGYKIIFYTHVSSLILLTIFAGYLYLKPVQTVGQVSRFDMRMNQLMIQLFCFHMTVIAMGDTFISGSIAAFMGSIFAIASFVFTSNLFALQLFSSNLILMICLLLYTSMKTGSGYSVQMMNAVIYTGISYLLSRLLFYYQLRDFSNRRLIKDQNEQLEKLAMNDHLTGALNRRSFLEKAQQELLRSERYQRPLGVVLFDIDYFKKVNDTYGHAAGDAVLVFISQIVKDNIRSSDLFARWGGEEFIILSPETDTNAITQISEKIRQLLETSKPENAPGVTASFGITCCTKNEKIDNVIHRADQALYKAKENGRNCVKVL